MNNMPIPYMYPFPNPNYQMPSYQNQDELKKLKYEIDRLKERVQVLEEKSKNNYLKKEEGMYIM